jgi:hypothetical protein
MVAAGLGNGGYVAGQIASFLVLVLAAVGWFSTPRRLWLLAPAGLLYALSGVFAWTSQQPLKRAPDRQTPQHIISAPRAAGGHRSSKSAPIMWRL